MALVLQGAGVGGSTVSLSCPMLTPTNYTVWAIKVDAILDAQGLWEAVSPEEGAAVDEKKNKTARAQLLSALSEDILMQVSTKKTAKEVWDSLKRRFVGADRVKKARLSTLKGEFDKLYMAEGELLDDYAGKISSMAARFASLGSTLSDADMVKKLLDTVPDRLYSAVARIEQFCDMETWRSRRWAGSRHSRNAHGGARRPAASGATASSCLRRSSGRRGDVSTAAATTTTMMVEAALPQA